MKPRLETPLPSERARLQAPALIKVAILLALILPLASGCRVARGVVGLPAKTVRTVTGGKPQVDPTDPVVLQQRLMRFSDDYSGRLLVASDALNETTNVISHQELIRLKLNLVGGSYAVATGPNAIMNLLDMFVLVTLTRMMVEEQWLPGAYGESARPMLDACRLGEAEISLIAAPFLTPAELAELSRTIDQWRREHPDVRNAVFTRALGLAAEMSQGRQKTPESSGSVFRLLMIDPLSGLDPAARELAQSRLFAERALFMAQRMPMTLRWQTELLALETAETPLFREIRTNTTQLTAAIERTSTVVEGIPALVRSEREALLNAVGSQETGLTNVTAELRATLEAGRQMSDSVTTALNTFDRLQQRLSPDKPGETNQPAEPSEPFRIQDYTTAAVELNATAERLDGLLRTFDQTLGSTNLAQLSTRVTPAVQRVETGGRTLVDYAFRRAVLLAAILCAFVILTALPLRLLRKTKTTA